MVASYAPNYLALYIYLAVVTAAAFALARMRMWRWLAITAMVFSLLWTFPGMVDYRVDALTPHLFHVIVGFGLAVAMLVAGFLYGPKAEPGKIDPISSFAVAGYLFVTLVQVVSSRHDALALMVFTALTLCALWIAWRTDAAAAAVPIAGLFAAVVIVRWALHVELAQLIATTTCIVFPAKG